MVDLHVVFAVVEPAVDGAAAVKYAGDVVDQFGCRLLSEGEILLSLCAPPNKAPFI